MNPSNDSAESVAPPHPRPDSLDRFAPLIVTFESALAAAAELGPGCPADLTAAIRYSLLAPGKRIRPLLTLLGCECSGGRLEDALPAACAVEMIHCYSLIHDDLPAMDDDDLRRGRPSCHIAFDEATAVLAGDALQARAFEILATQIADPALAARCVALLAKAAGPSGMVGGQADDLREEVGSRKAEGGDATQTFNPKPQAPGSEAGGGSRKSGNGGDSQDLLRSLEHIHERKTGAIIRSSLEMGAILARAGEERINNLSQYGRWIGLAFQIVDDLLDIHGDPNEIGKTAGKDAVAGKLTYPRLLGIKASQRLAAEMIDRARAVLSGERHDQPLHFLAEFIVSRSR